MNYKKEIEYFIEFIKTFPMDQKYLNKIEKILKDMLGKLKNVNE